MKTAPMVAVPAVPRVHLLAWANHANYIGTWPASSKICCALTAASCTGCTLTKKAPLAQQKKSSPSEMSA